jgi:hypothetical protein
MDLPARLFSSVKATAFRLLPASFPRLPRSKAAAPSSGDSVSVRDLTTEMGRGGVNEIGGQVYEEWLTELQGKQGQAIYREMDDNDPTLGGIRFAINMLSRQVPWDTEPPAATEPGYVSEEVHAEDAAFLKSAMFGMPEQAWDDVVEEAFSMVPHGHAVLEDVLMRRDDGRISWRKLAGRAQDTIERWEWDDVGNPIALVQQPPPTYEEITIPLAKCTHFRTSSRKNNPEGRSCYRNAYIPFKFKKRIQVIEGIGIERDLAGMPVAEIPEELFFDTATDEQKAILEVFKNLVTSIHRDEHEGIAMPKGYDDKGNDKYKLSLLSSGGGRQIDVGAVITRYDWDIARTFMAKFVMLGQTAVGAKSLAETDTNLFSVALGAWLKSICETLNRQTVPRLFRVNGITDRPLPRIVSGDIEARDLKPVAEALNILAQAGMQIFPTEDGRLEAALMRMGDLPWTEGAGLLN